jgi:hypothetical protein
MDDVKVELDSHSDAESTSLIDDDENVEGTSMTIPILKCETQVSFFFLVWWFKLILEGFFGVILHRITGFLCLIHCLAFQM